MTTLAAIRTHVWGEDEARLQAQLAPVFGDRLVVAFHNRPRGLDLPLPVIDIDDAWVARQGLRAPADWGWRCGDYALYALRAARPEARHYWIVEPDVFFTGPAAAFFAAADALDHDLLAVGIHPVPPDHRFARGMPGADHRRAIFALTRVSGRALDRLLPARRGLAAGRKADRFCANDEVFVHTTVAADPELMVGDLALLLPGWADPATMRTDPDLLIDLVERRDLPGIFHPVRGRSSFIAAVARRMVNRIGFLDALAPSLARLTPAELDTVQAEAALRLGEALRAAAARGRGADGTATLPDISPAHA